MRFFLARTVEYRHRLIDCFLSLIMASHKNKVGTTAAHPTFTIPLYFLNLP